MARLCILTLGLWIGLLVPCLLLAAEGVEVGDTAADFALCTLSGDSLSLSQCSGKVIVLSFFSVGCSSCRAELPDLERNLWRAYQSKGVQVLGVSRNDPADVRDAIEAFDLTFPVLVDTAREAWDKYGVTYVPLNLIIDRDMVIRYRQIGYDPTVIADLVTDLAVPSVQDTTWGAVKSAFQ